MIDLGSYNSWEKSEKRKINNLSIAIAIILVIPSVIIISSIWLRTGYDILKLAWFILLILPMIPIHELIHGAFQWIFSKKPAKLGFAFPFPFSQMAYGVSISRNKAAIVALAPFLFFALLLILIPLANSIMQIGIVILFWFNTSTCSGDFRFTSWLLKYPKSARIRLEGDNTIVFDLNNGGI